MKLGALKLAAGVIVVAAAGWAAFTLLGPSELVGPSAEIRRLVDGRRCEYGQLSLGRLHANPLSPEYGCGYLEEDGVRIESFLVDGPYGYYRVAYLKRGAAAPARFFIYLSGGPRMPTTGLGRRPLHSELVVSLTDGTNAGLLVPTYLGTYDRSLYPENDVLGAAEEVVQLIERLRSLHPDIRISVVAVSAGALVALAIVRRTPIPTVLTVPSPGSFRDFLLDTQGTDVPADGAARPSHFYRYRPGTLILEPFTATMAEQMSAFAGEDYDQSLAELIGRLPTARRQCLAIIYGTHDRRVRNARLAEVRAAFPSMPIAAIQGMGHGPASEEQARSLARTITQMMPAGCN